MAKKASKEVGWVCENPPAAVGLHVAGAQAVSRNKTFESTAGLMRISSKRPVQQARKTVKLQLLHGLHDSLRSQTYVSYGPSVQG